MGKLTHFLSYGAVRARSSTISCWAPDNEVGTYGLERRALRRLVENDDIPRRATHLMTEPCSQRAGFVHLHVSAAL